MSMKALVSICLCASERRPQLTYSRTYLLTYILTYVLTYLLIYLLHAA